MRLLATGRALRASSGRWSIAAPRHSILPLVHRPENWLTPRRGWSSTVARRTEENADAAMIAGLNHGKKQNQQKDALTIEGQSYKTDEWTNARETILSHVGRQLYLDENHPLAITRKLIESQFPNPIYGNYAETNPVVSTKDNFDILGFPSDHPGRSRPIPTTSTKRPF